MNPYADDLLLREARSQFFATHHDIFGQDGGYDAKWIRIELWPFPIFFPNMSGRDRAVRLHDLHHIVAGYDVDLRGEAEIGAWEVGGSCTNFLHAWVLNMGAMAMGLFIAPKRTFRAFIRGRHTDNLYHHYSRLDDALLERTVGELRQRLRLDKPIGRSTWHDRAAFIIWSLLSLAVASMFPLAALAIIAGVVLIAMRMVQ